MTTQGPPPPAPIITGARIRSFLGWAFVFSIVGHFVIGSIFPYKPFSVSEKETEKVSVTKKMKIAA